MYEPTWQNSSSVQLCSVSTLMVVGMTGKVSVEPAVTPFDRSRRAVGIATSTSAAAQGMPPLPVAVGLRDREEQDQQGEGNERADRIAGKGSRAHRHVSQHRDRHEPVH